jgi:hypothetical protein
VKVIDNALQRIKRTLDGRLSDDRPGRRSALVGSTR